MSRTEYTTIRSGSLTRALVLALLVGVGLGMCAGLVLWWWLG